MPRTATADVNLQAIVCGGGRFVLKQRIGSGSFGVIYLGEDLQDRSPVAVKVEHSKERLPQLIYESRVYDHIHTACRTDIRNSKIQEGLGSPIKLNSSGRSGFTSVTVGIPEVRWVGQEGDYIMMVMSLLGPSLEDLLTYCGRRFTLRTTAMLAIQIVSRIEMVHKAHYVHRDIKPENFLMGIGSRAHHVYVVDFGLAKKYWDATIGCHIAFKDGKPITGTARYCSINTHLGSEQGRRDDMEAIGYLLVYLHCGRLPWQGLKIADQAQKTSRIGDKKISTPVDVVCKNIDPVFSKLLKYSRAMLFEDTPNYEVIREWFTVAALQTPSLATLISGVSSVNPMLRRTASTTAQEHSSGQPSTPQLDWIYDWVAKRHQETKDTMSRSTSSIVDPNDSVSTQPHSGQVPSE